MTDEEFDRRMEALSQPVELLRASVSDLTAIVHALAPGHERAQGVRHAVFCGAATLLQSWAGENGNDA
jgi:hypothetical protein